MNGVHHGPMTLDRDGAFTGMVKGTLAIAPGVRVVMSGMVTGDIVVGAGAELTLSGMLRGAIENRGGRVVVDGLVTD